MFELLFQFVGEILLQVIFEAMAELGLRSAAAPFNRRPNPWLAALGYALFGALSGGLSVLVFPALFIDSPEGRFANLLLTPVLAGAAMALLGAWRRRRGQALIRLDRFAYGYLFALSMALTRWALAD
ncbi:MAG TPA: hypothetical protein DCY13_11705 [Verrucomicrobiales bacterium]|nr:hypothetical protein [Verrucomicrobiales bacterium]